MACMSVQLSFKTSVYVSVLYILNPLHMGRVCVPYVEVILQYVLGI